MKLNLQNICLELVETLKDAIIQIKEFAIVKINRLVEFLPVTVLGEKKECFD